jgi:hypothetical protein
VDWRWIPNAIALTVLVMFAAFIGPKVLATPGVSDAESYWMLDLSNPYAVEAGTGGAFLYSPLVAQLIYPFTLLPAWVLYYVLMAGNLGALVYLVGPIGAALALLLPPVAEELAQGNIHLLLAAALVLGVRHPGWWAAFPLTKVTPSVLFLWNPRGLLWAAGLALLSFVTVPELWFAWGERLMLSSQDAIPPEKLWTDWPLWFRLALASVVVLLARWRNRPLALPFALLLSLPLPWLGTWSVLLACVTLSHGHGRGYLSALGVIPLRPR